MAPDDVKYLFIHFMIMVAIGVPPRLHFHETGRTFSGIRFPNDGLYRKGIALPADNLRLRLPVIGSCSWHYLFCLP